MFMFDLTKNIDYNNIDKYMYNLYHFTGVVIGFNIWIITNDEEKIWKEKLFNFYPELKNYKFSSSFLFGKVLVDDTKVLNNGIAVFVDYQKKENKEYGYKPFSETSKNMIGKFIRVITADNTGNVYKIEGIGNDGIFIQNKHHDRTYFSLDEAFEIFAFWENDEYIPFGEKK